MMLVWSWASEKNNVDFSLKPNAQRSSMELDPRILIEPARGYFIGCGVGQRADERRKEREKGGGRCAGGLDEQMVMGGSEPSRSRSHGACLCMFVPVPA